MMSAPAGAAEPSAPWVRLPAMPEPPVIDGTVRPGEWEAAFMGSGVCAIRSGGMETIRVRYWFGYDRGNVYLAAQMETPPGKNLSEPPRRLAKQAEDFHFEILLDPVSGHPDKNWLQPMFHPMGVVKNLGYSQRIGGFVPYDVEWNYKDRWENDVWTIEATAPIEAFQGADLNDGATWGILVGGLISSGPYYFSGTVGESFSARNRFLKVIPDQSAPVIHVADIGDIASGNAAPRLEIRNPTASEMRLKVSFALRSAPAGEFTAGLNPNAPPDSGKSQTLVIPPEKSAETAWGFDLPAEEKTNQWLTIRVASEDGKAAWFEGLYKFAAPRLPKWKSASGPPPAAVLFETNPYPSFSKLRAVVDFGGHEEADKITKAVFRLRDASDAEIATASAVPSGLAAEEILALPANLPEGDYTAEADLLDAGGRVVAQIATPHAHRRFAFENNQLGVSDKVLPPWTPIRTDAKEQTLGVWNRLYTFDRSGFPAQIVSAGKPLLAAPVTLVETVDGAAAPLKGVSFAFTRTGPAAVEARATAAGRAAKAEIRLLAEYDGMIKYEVTLTGEKGAKLDALDLVIPLESDRALFLHATGDGCRSNYSHALPPGKGVVWDSSTVINWVMPVQWLTYLWLGDHERGLCWWADSAEGWVLPADRKTPTAEIRRTERGVEAVLRLISRPSPVLWKDETPRKFVFAIEATPIKPLPSWARDIGRNNPNATKQKGPWLDWRGSAHWAILGDEEGNKPGRYTYAYLRPVSEDAAGELKKSIGTAKTKGQTTLVYTDMRSRALVGDLEKQFAWEWSPSLDEPRRAFIDSAPYYRGIQINAVPSRVDYDLWCFNNLMDLGVGAFYFDEIQVEGQINPDASLGFRDETGRLLPTMRLFAYRDLWKRLYTLMQERGIAEPLIVAHNTSTTYAGPMAFITATWDIEEANFNPEERQLTRYGMDYLQTEVMGHQYGFVASTLGPSPGFERWLKHGDKEEDMRAARHWMGVHMLLEMNPYLTNHPAVVHGLKLLGDFGWNEPDSQWIPYWKALDEKLYTWTPAPEQRVYVAAYRRGAKALLIFLNDTNEDVTVNWKPAAFAPAGALTDAEDANVKIAPENGIFPVPVPRHNYRVFLVEVK